MSKPAFLLEDEHSNSADAVQAYRLGQAKFIQKTSSIGALILSVLGITVGVLAHYFSPPSDVAPVVVGFSTQSVALVVPAAIITLLANAPAIFFGFCQPRPTLLKIAMVVIGVVGVLGAMGGMVASILITDTNAANHLWEIIMTLEVVCTLFWLYYGRIVLVLTAQENAQVTWTPPDEVPPSPPAQREEQNKYDPFE